MRLLEINYPNYKLKHNNGHEFIVVASRTDDDRLTFHPLTSWGTLAERCKQDTESLLEDIDDVIYNATPEAYDK
jgi:hypothetical protein